MAKEKEPITPFLSKIKALTDLNVSCILVIGGSGDYFSVADTVLCMEDFTCKDVSAEAHSIAEQFGDTSAMQETPPYGHITARTPVSIYTPSDGSTLLFNDMCLASSSLRNSSHIPVLTKLQKGNASLLQDFVCLLKRSAGWRPSEEVWSTAGHGRGTKVSTRTIDSISYGTVELDLSGVEQLAEKSQTRAIAFALQLIASQLTAKHGYSILQLLQEIDANIDNQASSCFSLLQAAESYISVD